MNTSPSRRILVVSHSIGHARHVVERMHVFMHVNCLDNGLTQASRLLHDQLPPSTKLTKLLMVKAL